VFLLFAFVLGCTSSLWAQVIATPPGPPPDPPPPPILPQQDTPAVERVDGASLNLSETSIVNLVNRIGRAYKFLNIIDVTVAGDTFKDLALVADFSYASIDDRSVGGSGYDRTGGVYLTGRMAEDFAFGVGVSQTRYKIGGEIDLLEHVDTLDAYLAYYLTPEFSVGAFAQYSMFDIEESRVPDATAPLGYVEIGDQFDRYAAGLLSSYRKNVDFATLGLSASLASFNKRSPAKLITQHDAAFIAVFDIERELTDNLVIDVYTTFYTLLDNTGPTDGTYYLVGADLAYRLSEDWLLSLGYETDVAYSDYKEHRVNATIGYQW